MWQSLNNVLNPDEARQLLDGTLFEYHCPRCGAVTPVFYACLYHDMERHAMVQLVGEGSLDDARAMLDRLRADGHISEMINAAHYRQRIVTDQNELREKALIFRDELDDRTIETLKALICETDVGDGQVPEDALLFYLRCRRPETLELAAYGTWDDGPWESLGVLTVPWELYELAEDLVAAHVHEHGQDDSYGSYAVDRDWVHAHVLG